MAKDAKRGDLDAMVKGNWSSTGRSGSPRATATWTASSTFAQPDRRKAALDEHRAVIAAIRAGDRDAAVEAAQQHLHNARAARIRTLIGD